MAGASEDLELLFHAEKSNFLSRNDVLVLALHNFLLEEGARCVGKGDQWPDDASEKESKTLPRLWNEDQERTTLRYHIKKDKRIVLSVFADRDNTMATITDVAVNRTEGICLDVETYVNECYDTFESAYKNLEDLKKKLKEEVLTPLLSRYEKEPTSYRYNTSSWCDYGNSDPFMMMPGPMRVPGFGPQPRPTPFDYGRSDLDPFAGGFGGQGGGMLFDIPRPNRNPPIPGNFPRGAVPPGSRFDPIHPSTGMPVPRPGRPDPDVGPPPGYDDMFY